MFHLFTFKNLQNHSILFTQTAKQHYFTKDAKKHSDQQPATDATDLC